MGHEGESQRLREEHGKEAEKEVERLIREDPKLRGWKATITGTLKEGLDIQLEPPISCAKEPENPKCRAPLFFEVKSVEKLFEHDSQAPWPHNRTSRYTLKKDENPHCYVLVTRDDVTDRTAIDFVENTGELSEWKAKQHGKSQKLPVRALPRLRMRPCPFVTRHKKVIERY